MIGESVKLTLVAYTCTCSLIGVLPALVVGAVRATARVAGSSAHAQSRWLTMRKERTMRCFFLFTVHCTS